MARKNFINRLNDLSSKDWIKFQKSWFIHNPSPRNREVLRHPAKFPETLAQEFIEFFTKREQVVLDPMAGTGSTLVAALRCGRNSYGIELNPNYVEIAHQVIAKESDDLGLIDADLRTEMITGDAAQLPEIVDANNIPIIDYVLTSPPYWNMLHSRGAETQRNRRNSIDLDLFYSNDPNDLGNIEDYDEFLERLIIIYQGLKPYMKPRAYLTIIVKNIKKGGRIYPLAWDLAGKLCHTFQLKDERIWCQDNQRLAPYGIGNAWVSNTFHHYCLQFRNEL
jgi:DNA modification methylase